VTDPKKPALAPRDATRVKSVGTRRLPSDAFAHLPQPTIGPAMPGSIPMPRGHATEMKPRNAQFLENILRAAHEFGPTGAMAQAFDAGQDARSAVRERSPLKAVGALASLGLAAIPEARGAGKVAGKVAGEALDALPANPFHDIPEPPRVFHGTAEAFNGFHPEKLDPNALYGPGFYFTDDATTASGYAATKGPAGGYTREQIEDRLRRAREDGSAIRIKYAEEALRDFDSQAPNVRVARLALRHPLDMEGRVPAEDAARVLDMAGMSSVAARVREIGEPARGEVLYRTLTEEAGLSKADANALLKSAGFDGITHTGGANTGNAPHRVSIAFDREQVRSPWGDWTNAAQFGALGGLMAGSAAIPAVRKRTQDSQDH
jgi:hypothetical protein